MNQSKELREKTRKIEQNLEALNGLRMCRENITLAQCHALVEIGRMEATSLKNLAQKLNLDASTASKTVEKLLQKGLLSREQLAGNRRMVAIRLTEEGTRTFHRIEEDMNLRFQRISAKLSGDDLKLLFKALDVYNSVLEEEK